MTTITKHVLVVIILSIKFRFITFKLQDTVTTQGNQISYRPNTRAVRAVVPELLSRALASASARSILTKAFRVALLIADGKYESSTMNLRMFFLVNEAASIPPCPSKT